MEVKLKAIIVGERFRKHFDDIDALAESIKEYGVIEPLIIDENNNLIAGERRLRACTKLHLEVVPVVLMANLSDLRKKEVELEENIQRKQFTWQEEVDAKANLHKLKQRLHGAAIQCGDKKGWGLKNTAVALGESIGTLSTDLQLAEGIQCFPELKNEKNKTTAFKKLKRLQEQLLNDAIAKKLLQAGALALPNVINGNCIDELKKLKDESVELLLTDPPYAINIDNAHTFNRMTQTDVGFNDDEFETFDLLDKAFPEMFRVLKYNSHGFVFFGIDKYSTVRSLLEKHGFWVHPMPLVWNKGSGSYPGQCTTFVHAYEVFFHVMKGKSNLNGNSMDVFNIKRATDNKWHVNQKPTELLRDLIKLTTTPGDTVLDPFAGSGSTLIAAKETSRKAIGIELNPIFYDKIVKDLNQMGEEDNES